MSTKCGLTKQHIQDCLNSYKHEDTDVLEFHLNTNKSESDKFLKYINKNDNININNNSIKNNERCKWLKNSLNTCDKLCKLRGYQSCKIYDKTVNPNY